MALTLCDSRDSLWFGRTGGSPCDSMGFYAIWQFDMSTPEVRVSPAISRIADIVWMIIYIYCDLALFTAQVCIPSCSKRKSNCPFNSRTISLIILMNLISRATTMFSLLHMEGIGQFGRSASCSASCCLWSQLSSGQNTICMRGYVYTTSSLKHPLNIYLIEGASIERTTSEKDPLWRYNS
jgi:hypothetical protein